MLGCVDAQRTVLDTQAGVIARRQLTELGIDRHEVARMLRRRELTKLHPGVYLDHTGMPTWLQRAWGAVLFSWPAALSHQSAIRAADGPGRRGRDETTIHVTVARSRHLVAPAGVRLHRVSDLDSRVLWNLGPPRVRIEDAVVDIAAGAATELDAIAVLAEACGSRRTTALRLLEAVERRPRVPRRGWLTGVLHDVASGTCSVLEHGYLVRVERPHGLPTARRQASGRHGSATVYRDAEYEEFDLVVELDGRLFHDSAQARDRDMDRDLDAAADGRVTLRVGYGQVFDRACATARRVGAVLARRGWTEQVTSCPECG